MTARTERKVVTVLFADLVGFTHRSEQLDPEDVAAILRPYHERLRAELERFGGTVEKFIGDAVMALFGAPVAHEDDPERAVLAALAIRDWIAEEGDALEVRIAVNTGEALVRLGARPLEGEGMAVGDVPSWLQGRCLSYGEGITYWALGQLVKEHAGILESDSPEEALSKLADAVESVAESRDRQWLQARLAPLVGAAVGDEAVEQGE